MGTSMAGVAKRFVKARPRLYRVARAGRLWAGRHVMRPRAVPGLPGRVHANDLMMAWGARSSVEGYAYSGQRAADVVEDALARTERTTGDVGAALDFGCGYGRVLRFLVQRGLAPSHVWVTDIDSDAVAFCASEFGVHPLFATDSIAAMRVCGFDLIYAFSVLTHLPEREGGDLVAFFARALESGGVVVFTTHGRASLARLPSYGDWCAADAGAIEREVTEGGFSYRPYPHYSEDGYGLAWHDPDYIRALVDRTAAGALEFVHFGDRALDEHQDVYVLRRR